MTIGCSLRLTGHLSAIRGQGRPLLLLLLRVAATYVYAGCAAARPYTKNTPTGTRERLFIIKSPPSIGDCLQDWNATVSSSGKQDL
ncbi:hypothetical protein AND_001676 [Anopheles darlingi]|uniref:Uncharacterized protein n=1 Tax=Anopheles darlingi TaxID=43151 RepID=W5JTC4_ANODA|nr:hypothetical protein AND_001676 [Anopheles darlingi]